LAQVRVRDVEARALDGHPVDPEEIEIDDPRPPVDGADASQARLDGEEGVEELGRRALVGDEGRGVQERRLRRAADRRRLVDARRPLDTGDAPELGEGRAHRRQAIAEVGTEADDGAELHGDEGWNWSGLVSAPVYPPFTFLSWTKKK